MRFLIIIKKLFMLGLFALPIIAKTDFNTPRLLEGHNHSIWNKFYITAGWHDGGRSLGFFMPGVWHNADAQVWWDTGIILKGSGMGCRKMVGSNHFIGGYVYYDVMSLEEWLAPVRLNIGSEWGGHWGTLTINAYSTLLESTRSQLAYDKAGISAKASCDALLTSIKPFITVSYAWAAFAHDAAASRIPSIAFGAKWIISDAVDFEIKRIWDEHQSPLHAGFQMRWGSYNPKSNYVKHRFNQPPDRYIPHYANSIRIAINPTLNGLTQMLHNLRNSTVIIESKNKLAADMRTYTNPNGMLWIGMDDLEERHDSDVVLEVQPIWLKGRLYHAGSTHALRYSATQFAMDSADAIVRAFFKNFEFGFHPGSDALVLYPITGIAVERPSIQ